MMNAPTTDEPDDSSLNIYINGNGGISDILSGQSSSSPFSSSLLNNQQEEEMQFSTLHFMNKSDLLIKISRIIFEDFHNHMLVLYNKRNHEQADETASNEDCFIDIIQKFMEICECGVKGIETICADTGHMDPNSKTMKTKLILERAAYSLVLRIHNSHKLLVNNQELVSTTFLTNLFRKNEQFRRISILLLWSEEASTFSPTEFSRIANEDARKLSELDNIYACTKIRAPVHIDSRFVDRIAAEDEEAVKTLIIFMREFLSNPKLSPMDRFDDQFNLGQSRIHFKQIARELIPKDEERIQRTDQCIWATLGGHLPTLLSYAHSTEDRLWSHLSCAAEALLDQTLTSLHSKLDEEINLLATDLARDNEDMPSDVHSIFTQLRINEDSPYYAIFEYLALEQWGAAEEFIDDYVQSGRQVTAHEIRFFIHLMLLFKFVGKISDMRAIDRLIEQYTAMLIEMKLNTIVPLYLFHLSEGQSTNKILQFLEEITLEPEQKQVLESAAGAGFDVPELCREIFNRFKAKYKIEAKQSEQQIAKSAQELLRAWKWLTYCGPETMWHAIVEANYILRKLFLHNRMSEAVELVHMIPGNLDALKIFQNEFPQVQVPAKLTDAKHEFDCYQLYFEAIGRYGEWQKHVEGSEAPEMPAKLSDERWARMDIRRRAEYEMNVKKAMECMQKYYRVVEFYKKNAIEMLEHLLKMSNGWLAGSPLDEESADQELVERNEEFVEIRKQFLATLLELLIDIHNRSDEPMRVLDVGTLLMSPEYNLYKSLTKDKLQKLLVQISKCGAALL